MAERTLISINFPNFITIGFIAVATFLLLGVVWQLVQNINGGSNGPGDDVPISTGGSVVLG